MVLQNLTSIYITSWQVNTPVKLFGLAFLLTLFFTSCEEPLETDSIKLVPADSNTKIKSIELPVSFTQAAFDESVVSSNNYNGTLQQIFFGKNVDPQIGVTELAAYSSLVIPTNLNRDSVSFASIVDINFIMRLSNLYGDEFQQGQDVIVHQLTEQLLFGSDGYFKLNDSFAVQPNRISEFNTSLFFPTVHNPTTTPDSVSAVSVPLKNSFGQFILDGIMDTDLKTEDIADYLKGIKISTDGSLNALQGLEIGSGDSFIEVIYKNASKAVADTIKISLTTTSFTNAKFVPTGIMPDNYSANKEFQLNDPEQFYYNGMLAIYPRISINNYFDFIDTLDFMLINKAELVMEDDQFQSIATNNEGLLYPNVVYPYYIEGENILKKGEVFWGVQANFSTNGAVNDQTAANNLATLAFNEAETKISGDISFFLQQIYQDQGFWNLERDLLLTGQFIPANVIPFDPNAKLVMRSFRKFQLEQSKIKLKIYYTTFQD
ncbi:MAG: hypothetical protein ACI9C9_001458 [Marivirga sp.]|jgi:hypothetical protein